MTPALRAQVMREWQPFGKPPAPPVIPALDKLVPGVMQRLGLEQRLSESQIYESWAKIVGADIAKHAQPVSLQKGLLKVAVDHSGWLQELSRYHKKMMLEKIRNRVGEKAVRDIQFQLG